MLIPESLEITALQHAYAANPTLAERVLRRAYERIVTVGERPIWIELVPEATALAALRVARARLSQGENLPLLGIPFAVKDNIDAPGLATTAGCPAYRYQPERGAEVVERLIQAGAILIGKTNLDQFATGLVGTRSPYGVCSSAFGASYISGGSSSGSALAVAHGLVSFALGTDTAGSGRVPAAFNNLVGLKPTRGALSTRGVVPACRSLDVVSIFANSARDAALVYDVVAAFDPDDAYSRRLPAVANDVPGAFTFGVPQAEQLEFFSNHEYARSFEAAARRLESLGGVRQSFDLAPFLAAAELLYGGPWVAERFAAVGEFIEANFDDIEPTVRHIILDGRNWSAIETFRGAYELAAYKRHADETLAAVDVLLLPTAPTHYTTGEVQAEPLELNKRLGRYTNFVNLLDLAGVAVPAGFTAQGLPFGITLLGEAFSERKLLALAGRFHATQAPRAGATNVSVQFPEVVPATRDGDASEVHLAVVGAHLAGQPLHGQLREREARFVRTCRTSAEYRLYALAGTVPPKPGLVFEPGFVGPGIEVEVWSLSQTAFGSFVAAVPAPMTIGTATLNDGTTVKSFLCEPWATEGAREITQFGGWRAYLAS